MIERLRYGRATRRWNFSEWIGSHVHMGGNPGLDFLSNPFFEHDAVSEQRTLDVGAFYRPLAEAAKRYFQGEFGGNSVFQIYDGFMLLPINRDAVKYMNGRLEGMKDVEIKGWRRIRKAVHGQNPAGKVDFNLPSWDLRTWARERWEGSPIRHLDSHLAAAFSYLQDLAVWEISDKITTDLVDIEITERERNSHRGMKRSFIIDRCWELDIHNVREYDLAGSGNGCDRVVISGYDIDMIQ